MFKKISQRIAKRPPGGTYQASGVIVEPVEGVDRVECEYGDILEIPVVVTNDSGLTLDPASAHGPDLLSYHWTTPGGDPLVSDGLRTRLPASLSPGESAHVRLRVSVSVPAPDAVLIADVVREGEFWFADVGGTPMRLPFTIDSEWAAERFASAGGEEERAQAAEDLPSVGELWGQRARTRHAKELMGWLDHPTLIRECIIPSLGSAEENWLPAVTRSLGVPRGGRWLSIGCGDGDFEMWLLERGEAAEIEGIDISEGAVELANRTAGAKGLSDRATFRVLDLNREQIPEGSYDVVIASMAIHHIEDLDQAFEKIHRGLKPGGFFIANEYVGPNRFDFPERQRRLADDLIAVLPKELRFDTVASAAQGKPLFKDHYEWRSPEHWLEVDPSEAVRSADIVPVLKRLFDPYHVLEYGGTLLHLVCEHIIANFDPADGRDRAILRTLYALESELIKSGSLGSDFAILVGRRRE